MIVRSPRPATHFTILANSMLRDASLSYRARGVLARILSMPDNWATSAEELAATGPEGRDAIRKALRELEARGYIRRHRVRDNRGRIRIVTTVYDTPSPETENQSPVNQSLKKTVKEDPPTFTHTLTDVFSPEETN